jgi:hypothetical protein
MENITIIILHYIKPVLGLKAGHGVPIQKMPVLKVNINFYPQPCRKEIIGS